VKLKYYRLNDKSKSLICIKYINVITASENILTVLFLTGDKMKFIYDQEPETIIPANIYYDIAALQKLLEGVNES
jgi:hypothetical protein